MRSDRTAGLGRPAGTPLADRLRRAVLKPDDGRRPPAQARPRSTGELEPGSSALDDKERAIGLVAAPLASAIGLLVITALIDHDPPARLAGGLANPKHVALSLYHELMAVLVLLSVAMLAFSLLRKRLPLGIATALYGLAIFNLHYWGFGVPFIMCAAWLLVRAYRAQRDLKAAHPGTTAAAAGSRRELSPGASRRYTPPRPPRAAAGGGPARRRATAGRA
jgi:hypothetical protein